MNGMFRNNSRQGGMETRHTARNQVRNKYQTRVSYPLSEAAKGVLREVRRQH